MGTVMLKGHLRWILKAWTLDLMESKPPSMRSKFHLGTVMLKGRLRWIRKLDSMESKPWLKNKIIVLRWMNLLISVELSKFGSQIYI
jgi:hypothetical protein